MSELYFRMQPFLGDKEKLFERMAGRMDLWEECVFLFPREEVLREMEEALQAEDENTFYGTVHRLKGNLANFGFDSAAEKAMAVLRAIKKKNDVERDRYYTELREEYTKIIERIGDVE